MTTRGDVVIVEFPYVDGTRGKNRPALVVQCDRNNQRLLAPRQIRDFGRGESHDVGNVDRSLKLVVVAQLVRFVPGMHGTKSHLTKARSAGQ